MKHTIVVSRIILEIEVPHDPAAGVLWFIDYEEDIPVGEITVKDDHAPLTATVTWVDAEGSPTTPSGDVTWSSTDESVASIDSTSEDGNTATIGIGSPGAAVVEVATTQEDGDEIVAQGTITVQPGDVEMGSIEFSEATEEPPAEEPPAEETPV